MKTAILTIGDELLYGQTIDTNSAFLARGLISIGYEPAYKETVGDVIEAVEESIIKLCHRAKLVIATGGLGPTHDDITKKAICRAFKRNLVLYDDILKFIGERYARQKREMPAAAQSQALLPQGCRPLQNNWGTAPGIVIEERGVMFVALPGVPFEMENLFNHQLKPLLPPAPGGKVITFKQLRTSGIVESVIYEKEREFLGPKEPVKVAFLPGYSGVDLRLTVKDTPRSEAEKQIREFEAKIRGQIEKYIYAEGEATLSEAVGNLLREKKVKLATAESCTGGLLSKILTDIPGSSDYYLGGVVSYSNESKIELLNVPAELIEKFGAVSSEVAEAMALGTRKITHADFALSITGIAGPTGGSEGKPVGTTWIGMATDDGVSSKQHIFGADREVNRMRAAVGALNMLRMKLIADEAL